MSDEQLEWVKDKIDKLLRLANNNPNVEEAAAAAKQAQRLMTKYSIEQATVQLDEDDSETESAGAVVGTVTVASGKRLSSWRTVLANVIAKPNRCRVVLIRHGSFREMQFVGIRDDVSLCVSLYNLLMPMIDRMAKSYAKSRRAERGKAKTIANSYRFGAVSAIRDKLREGAEEERSIALRDNPRAAQALARLDDAKAKIDRYLGDTIKTTKVRGTPMDSAAWHQGRDDGKRIDLGTPKKGTS